jgi:YTH domain-containing family protein
MSTRTSKHGELSSTIRYLFQNLRFFDLSKLTNCLDVQQQGYNTPISTSMATSDPYMSNYYGTTSFPYQAFGVGDGTWSNGGDPMTFLGGYGGQMAAAHESYNMEGMFGTGGFGTFNQPTGILPPTQRKDVQFRFQLLFSLYFLAGTFNYFPGSGATDYSTWGGGAGAGGLGRKQHYEDYYRAAPEGGYIPQQQAQQPGDERVKAVEQGMQGLGLSDKNKDLKDGQQLQVIAIKMTTSLTF